MAHRGLEPHIADLIVLTVAAQTDHRLVHRSVLGSDTYSGEVGRAMPGEIELVPEVLPDASVWRTAVERAALLFGITVHDRVTGPELASLGAQVRARAGDLKSAADTLADVLGAAYREWGLEGGNRLDTARAGRDLVTALAQADDNAVVDVLAQYQAPSSDDATAKSLTSATVVTTAIRNANLPLWNAARVVVGADADAAFTSEEIVTAFEPAATAIEARATAHVAQPGPTPPVTPAAWGADRLPAHHRREWSERAGRRAARRSGGEPRRRRDLDSGRRDVSLPTISRAQLEPLLARILGNGATSDPAPLVIVRGNPTATPPTATIGTRPVDVVASASPLDIRARAIKPREQPLVIITSCDAGTLGDDLVARTWHRKVYTVDRWNTVAQLFGAERVTRSLAANSALADALIEGTPVNGYPKVTTQILDLDTALDALANVYLGARPETLSQLIAWGETPDAPRIVRTTSPDVLSALEAHFEQSLGPGVAVVFAAIRSDHGAELMHYALAADVTHRPDANAGNAVFRLELALGDPDLGADAYRDLGRAAVDRVRATSPDAAPVGYWLSGADQLLAEWGAERAAIRSDVLPSGFTQRIAAAAERVDGVARRRRTRSHSRPRHTPPSNASLTTTGASKSRSEWSACAWRPASSDVVPPRSPAATRCTHNSPTTAPTAPGSIGPAPPSHRAMPNRRWPDCALTSPTWADDTRVERRRRTRPRHRCGRCLTW